MSTSSNAMPMNLATVAGFAIAATDLPRPEIVMASLKLVGEGKWHPADFRDALDARDRSRCGPLAPPQGLYLTKVDY